MQTSCDSFDAFKHVPVIVHPPSVNEHRPPAIHIAPSHINDSLMIHHRFGRCLSCYCPSPKYTQRALLTGLLIYKTNKYEIRKTDLTSRNGRCAFVCAWRVECNRIRFDGAYDRTGDGDNVKQCDAERNERWHRRNRQFVLGLDEHILDRKLDPSFRRFLDA
jgi:hypothetical protein